MAAQKDKAITEITTSKRNTNPADIWRENSKKITIVGGVVIALLLGWIGYKKMIVEPKAKNAAEAIFPAENLFDKMASTTFSRDSVAIILNGGSPGGTPIAGLLKIAKDYSGTEAANRANYMIGASYLQIKEFDKAIQYLKDFDGNGADQIQSRAYIMIGHAYAEKKNVDEALNYYKKAASVNGEDELMTSNALLTAASYAGMVNKKEDAISLYKQLQKDYPTSTDVQNGEVEKQLAKLGVTE